MVSGWAAVDVVVVWLGLGLGPGNAYREWYWSGGRLKTRGTVCSCCWAPFGTWNGQGWVLRLLAAWGRDGTR